jgi:hypothetical protein
MDIKSSNRRCKRDDCNDSGSHGLQGQVAKE